MIEGGERSVYFAGDTDVFAGMAELAPGGCRAAADLGLGADDGAGSHGPGSVPPRRPPCSGARLAIPIHWGTYYPIHLGLRGPPGFLSTPPALFEEAVQGARARDRGSGAPARASEPSSDDVTRAARRNACDAGVHGSVLALRPDPLVEARSLEGLLERPGGRARARS